MKPRSIILLIVANVLIAFVFVVVASVVSFW